MTTYEAGPGEHIETTAENMAVLAKTGDTITATFNDIVLTCGPKTEPSEIVKYFSDESDRRRNEYLASPEYAKQQQERKDRDARKRLMLEGALLSCPAKPTMLDQEKWDEWVKVNQDPYGAAICQYAETWARLMEGRLAAGDTIEHCADNASHIADTVGLTGFAYGCAVSMLALCWKHGEELRKWHNLTMQIGNEGESANEKPGAVLNPALLRIE